jgi:putative transposase
VRTAWYWIATHKDQLGILLGVLIAGITAYYALLTKKLAKASAAQATATRLMLEAGDRPFIGFRCDSLLMHGNTDPRRGEVAKLGDRWAALKPIRQGVHHAFGAFRKDVARGLAVRCDWGPQYIADAWIQEVKWLGITISPSYVGEPECNGIIERFMRTLKEQCLYLHRFQTLEEARRVIAEFIERYNREWLIERLDYRTPAQARAEGWRAAA